MEWVNTSYTLLIYTPFNASYTDCVMDINEQKRIDAVNRYIKGDKPADICRGANRSKKWFTGWADRFKTGEDGWHRSRSRAPKKHGRKTNEEYRVCAEYPRNPHRFLLSVMEFYRSHVAA